MQLIGKRSEDWVAHVIADCPPEGTLDKIMKYFEGHEKIKKKLKFSLQTVMYRIYCFTDPQELVRLPWQRLLQIVWMLI